MATNWHLPVLAAMPQVELKWICDIDRRRAENSWQSVATAYEGLYREALAQHDPSQQHEPRGSLKGR